MLERIVCATDLSPTAELAARCAASVASAFGGSLELVNAWNAVEELVEYPALDPALILEARQKRLRQLETMASSYRSRGRRVIARVVDGPADRAIVTHAAEMKADLLVVGTEGRRGIAHALLGSVAERILRTSDVPVLAVPKSWSAVDHFAPREILVPVDLGPASAEVLRFATRIGAHVGARVVALHVWGATLLSAAGPQAESTAQQMREGFDGWMHETLGHAGHAIERVVERGDPAETIERVATSRPIELVVMATAGRTGLEHFLLGSVTERTLRNAGRPVLGLRRPPVVATAARADTAMRPAGA